MDHQHHHNHQEPTDYHESASHHRNGEPHQNHQGHEHQHHEHSMHGGPQAAADFLRRFYIVTGLLVPLFILSMAGMAVFQYEDFVLRRILELVITSVIFGFGFIFFEHALHEIRSRQIGMMTLVSIAVGAGYLFSVAATFIPALEAEFNLEIATLIWILLFGHYLEAKSSTAAGNALDEVAKLLPKQAHVKHGEMVHDIDVSALQEGDIVVIKPGEKAPADGVITSGRSLFNQSHISGESKPIEKQVGDRVVAGAIAQDGSVEVKLDKVGSNSTIGQIQALIASAKQTKPSAQRLADKAANLLTITAVTISLATLLVWSLLLGEPVTFSITLAITVLVIACPHALGLAIPTVSTIATRLAARHGMFIKDMGKLEIIKDTDYVIFDKTGTLTQGSFGIVGSPDKDLVQIAASLEQASSHVIGISIVNYANQQGIALKPVTQFKNSAGKGIEGSIDGTKYYIGNAQFIEEKQLELPKVDTQGSTIIYVATDTAVIGTLKLSDQIKPGAVKAIKSLHRLGIKVAMITGDNEGVAKAVAHQLDIDEYVANVLPQDKFTHVKKLQDVGNTVVMVGDGVNDAPALTQANVGVAIGAGTDVAVEAGDIVLTRSNPEDIATVIVLARKVYQKMYQNLWWALGYNIIAIPAAAGVFIPFGFQLSPQIGAIAMALSSVVVVINALTLRNVKIVTT